MMITCNLGIISRISPYKHMLCVFIKIASVLINPYLPSGLVHPYYFSFKESLVFFFIFNSISNRNSCQQTV